MEISIDFTNDIIVKHLNRIFAGSDQMADCTKEFTWPCCLFTLQSGSNQTVLSGIGDNVQIVLHSHVWHDGNITVVSLRHDRLYFVNQARHNS